MKKKISPHIMTLLHESIRSHHRSMILCIGDHGKDAVPNLHHILSQSTVATRPSVLWCYKTDLGFSTHRKKRMKKINRDKERGLLTTDSNTGADSFELFLTNTDITWCYYKDSHRALGNTYGMCVLQDFDSITPNLLARTIETVRGGGVIVLLVNKVESLKQLYSMSMDVHDRYRSGDKSNPIVPRFNERFLLSLGRADATLVIDDEFNILPLSDRTIKKLKTVSKNNTNETTIVAEQRKTKADTDLESLVDSLSTTPHINAIIALAKTLDQATAILTFLECCTSLKSKQVCTLTAGRGRGKSAAIGLCLAGAVAFQYANIFVTAPEVTNTVAVFDFVVRGLTALKYTEHLDYTIKYTTTQDGKKFVTEIALHRDHRQVIKYVSPTSPEKFTNADLIAIDEAAAIPLPVVKRLMQNENLTFMSSTINGYEGTGRSLSLKLIKDLREKTNKSQNQKITDATNAIAGAKAGVAKGEKKVHEERWAAAAAASAAIATETAASTGDALKEIELTTPIRYSSGDPIEKWLNELLCLDSGSEKNPASKLNGGTPAPASCELYSVNRDALFSYHKLSESFLQKMMSLYTAAHYKNSPNDLQMLSDAPAHNVFVLLSPNAGDDATDSNSLPDILAVVQTALEGKIERKNVEAQLSRGQRAAGDLIPWTVSQQFGDPSFAQLSGARIVRVAVHPDVQGMGYGTRAVEMLYRFYNGDIVNTSGGAEPEEEDVSDEEEEEEEEERVKGASRLLSERVKPRKKLPPLLLPLSEVPAPKLDWIGSSFGLTPGLFKFWSRTGMKMLYLRQTSNELTGEHSSIMVRALPKQTAFNDAWLPSFVADARRRFIALLGGMFSKLDLRSVLTILEDANKYQHATTAAASASAANRDEGGLTKKQRKQVNAATNMMTQIEERGGASGQVITVSELNHFLTPHDLKRLELYGRNLCDHHLITDLVGVVAKLYFTGRMGSDFQLSSVQGAVLCGIGLQNKSIDDVMGELGLPQNQVLAMFNKAVRKVSISLGSLVEGEAREEIFGGGGESVRKAQEGLKRMEGVSEKTLGEEEEEAADEAMGKLREKVQEDEWKGVKVDEELKQYAVKGNEEDWAAALGESEGGVVRVKSKKEKGEAGGEEEEGVKSVKRSADYYENEQRSTLEGVGKKMKVKKGEEKKKKARKSMGGLE